MAVIDTWTDAMAEQAVSLLVRGSLVMKRWLDEPRWPPLRSVEAWMAEVGTFVKGDPAQATKRVAVVELSAQELELLRDAVELWDSLDGEDDGGPGIAERRAIHRKLRRAEQEQIYAH